MSGKTKTTRSEGRSVLPARDEVVDVLDRALHPMMVFDATDLAVLYANQAARQALQHNREAFGRLNAIDVGLERDRASFEALVGPVLGGELREIRWDATLRRRDGSGMPASVRMLHSRWGGRSALVATVSDPPRVEPLKAAASHHSDELQLIIDAIPAIVFVKDTDNCIVRANRAAASAHGSTPEQLAGTPVVQWSPEQAQRYYQDDLEVMASGRPKLGIIEPLEGPEPELRWLRTDKFPLRDAAGEVTGIIVIATDITQVRRDEHEILRHRDNLDELVARRTDELARANAELERLARIDDMTGLSNRRYVMERLDEEVHRARRHGTPLAVMLLDLDLFKEVNDTYGHLAGDVVLRDTAQIIQASMRTTDIKGRFGGEEFVTVMPQTTAEGARIFAERLREAIGAQIHRDGDSAFRVTASIGVAGFCPETPGLEDLLRLADRALYQAKRLGRDRVCVAGDPAPEAPGGV